MRISNLQTIVRPKGKMIFLSLTHRRWYIQWVWVLSQCRISVIPQLRSGMTLIRTKHISSAKVFTIFMSLFAHHLDHAGRTK